MAEIPWTHDLDAACKKAEADDKLVLLDFFSPTWGGCARLEAVTYPEPLVAQIITERFIPVQVNTQEDAGKVVVQRYRQAWTPDIRMIGPDGFDYASWVGYLPPAEYVPQLLVSQAMAYLRMQNNERAAAVYKDVLNRFPTSAAAPEAGYFFAVATYKDSHEGNDLLGRKGWQRVQTRYPLSTWRVRQSWAEEK